MIPDDLDDDDSAWWVAAAADRYPDVEFTAEDMDE